MTSSLPAREGEVLLLCTANLCRSPMAAGLLTVRLTALGRDVRVHSAGGGPADQPVPPPVLTAVAPYGVDLSAHRSRVVTRELVDRASLVIGMAAEHVHEAIRLAPDVWGRAFTLKELVRRAEAVGPRRLDESLADWVARLGPGDVAAGGGRSRDDVADPIGGPRRGYQRTAEELDVLVERLVDLGWPVPA